MSIVWEKLKDDEVHTELKNTSGIVLVDFWAQWCSPCVGMMPLINDIAKQYEGEAQVVKVDVEANPNTADKFNVRSFPTLVLLKDGAEINRIIGTVTKTRIASFIDEALEE